MKSSFWSYCQGLVRRLQQSRTAPRPRLRQRSSWMAEPLEARTLLSSTPAMVADINPGAASSNQPWQIQIVAVGSTTFFTADDGVHGQELWKSDGTAAGTKMVKDIDPGSGASGIRNLTNVNGTLFFTADDGVHGGELWKSDGTEAGTVMVDDLNPGIGWGIYANNLTDVNGTLFFTGNDGTRVGLWKSDGTASGTVLVTSIVGNFTYGTDVNGTLFFTADDGVNGEELWKSDGTAAGTTMVEDINPSTTVYYDSYGGRFSVPNSSHPRDLTNVNGTLYFSADDGVNGTELWKSDGTAAGTTLVRDIAPGTTTFYYYDFPISSNPRDLTNVNGTLFFTADDGTHGYRLWKSDGTAAGTVMVPGTGYSPDTITNVNGTIFFEAYGNAGWELWKTDGTAAGSTMVKDIIGSSIPYDFTNVNGTLFFTANDGVHGYELWKSDGTAAGTVMLADINAGSASSYPGNLTNANGTLFFMANDGIHGDELWTLPVASSTPAPSLIVGGFPPTTTAGSAGSFAVTVKNADGTADTSYVGKVHFTSTDPQAVLPADYTFTAADHGTHTFSAILKTAGTHSITATDTKTPGTAGAEANILVKPAAASTMFVGGFPSPNTAGVVQNLVVTLKDPYGNIATGYAGKVHFTSSDPQAVLPADYTFTAADQGTHTFSANLKTAGTQWIAATDTQTPGVSGVESTILVKPAAASTMFVGGFHSPATAGVAGNVTVTLRDSYGNIATGYAGKVHFTSSDPQAVLPADYTFIAADQGTHTFSATLKTSGNQSISATDTQAAGLAGIEVNILVQSAPVGTMFVGGFHSPATAGVVGNVTVTLKNPDGTTNTGYTGKVHFTSSDPQAVLPADYTFTAADKGTRTFSATLRTAGNQSLSASDTQAPGLSGVEVNILVQSAAASAMTVGGFPSTTTAGAPHDFTVTLKDPYGNVATGYTGTVRFSSSDSKAVLPARYAFTAADAGKHTFTATLKTAGSQSITAADVRTSALAATQGAITVTAAAANKFLITAPSTVQAGAAFHLTVTALDTYGNVAGYTGTVRFASTDKKAALPADYTFTAADSGLHTFTGLVLRTTGKRSISINDALNGSLTATVTENVT